MPDAVSAAKRSRRNAPAVVRRLFLLAVILYFLPLLALGVFQKALVFGASATHGGSAEAPPEARLLWLRTQSGTRFEAYYGHALLRVEQQI